MASGSRARLPVTPNRYALNFYINQVKLTKYLHRIITATTNTVTTNVRHHIDVQNNTISSGNAALLPDTTFSSSSLIYNNNNISDDIEPEMMENMSSQERQMILNVLNRDASVRQRDAARVM